MSGKSIEDLFALVEQVMQICTQTGSRSEALESLLIDKGFVTKAELDARTEKLSKETKKLADALSSSGGQES